MSAVPRRPPRTSRPISCHGDASLSVDGRDVASCSDDDHHQDMLAENDGTQSDVSVSVSCVTRDASDRKAAAVEEHAALHPSEDCVMDMLVEEQQTDEKRQLHDCGKTETGVSSHNATPVKPRVATPTASTEVKFRCSPKTRKAPPVPPPPTAASKEPRPSSASSDKSLEMLPVKDVDSANETEHCRNVLRDTSPCSKSTAVSTTTSASNPDSKPALKPKPICAIARESVGSEGISDSSSRSANTPSLRNDHASTNSEPVPTSYTATVTTAPVYSVVNKPRTLRSMSNTDSDTDKLKKLGTSVTVARSQSAVVPPPKKPPRTFAHSEYMRLKSLSLPRSSESPSGSDSEETGSSVKTVPTNTAENTDPLTRTSEDDVDGDGSIRRQTRDGSEPVSRSKDCCFDGSGKVKRRQSDKLPAPPRPPPPSFPDKRSSTLSCRSSMIDADTAAASHSEKYHSKDSSCERPARSSLTLEPAVRPESGSDVPVDDDIYAVPGEVNDSARCGSDAGRTLTCISSAASESTQLTIHPSASPSRLSSTSDGSASSTTGTVTGDLDSSLHHGSSSSVRRRQEARAKVSNAYSVLRLNAVTNDDTATQADDAATHDDPDDDSDGETSEMEEHRQRMLRHVADTRHRTRSRLLTSAVSRVTEPDRLFDYAVAIGLVIDDDCNHCVVHVLFHHPEQSEESLTTVARHCFPDASAWRPVTIYDGDMFSFVVPESSGCRQFGYCRRFLPPGAGNRLPQALCVVSQLSEMMLYDQLLCATENRLRSVDIDSAYDLLRTAYNSACPQPNHEINIRTAGLDGRKMITVRRAGDSRPENVCYDRLLSSLSEGLVVNVFGSILLERRIIFCAQRLSTLTSCIQSVLSLLYPFEWQHVYVPVLPTTMIDVLDSSLPYVIGILASTYAQLLNKCTFQFDEMLVVDVDGGRLLHCYGDEQRIIPRKLHKALISSIKDDADNAAVRDAVVSEAFLRFFVETCGHYTEYICTQQDGLRVFERELFVKAVSSPSIRLFLEWFTSTQMFEVFMTDQLAGRSRGTFESRIVEYREEMTELSTSLRQNVKNVGKKIKEFLVESSGKIKKKFQRNVFI